MRKYREEISESSLWLTATPSPCAMTLPFYIVEMGHFLAQTEYMVERREHDSHLLLYTVKGCGRVITGGREILLAANQALVIDCRKYHKYHSLSDPWEFFWIHLNGIGMQPLFDIMYPQGETAADIDDSQPFYSALSVLLSLTESRDILSNIKASAKIHEILSCLARSAARVQGEESLPGLITRTLQFIEAHYAQDITVDDIIRDLPVSKYHFIRLFGRVMGTTPYSYLISYRINVSKTLLATTRRPVSQIAEDCGFADTSNFINHFKKRTGLRPLQYRNAFSQKTY